MPTGKSKEKFCIVISQLRWFIHEINFLKTRTPFKKWKTDYNYSCYISHVKYSLNKVAFEINFSQIIWYSHHCSKTEVEKNGLMIEYNFYFSTINNFENIKHNETRYSFEKCPHWQRMQNTELNQNFRSCLFNKFYTRLWISK